MKTVTQSFKDAWGAKYGKVSAIKVLYKRRYWTGSAYTYESSWKTMSAGILRDLNVPKNFNRVGEIVQKLDFPLLNNIRSSSVSLLLNNLTNSFLPSNINTSIFAPDATATSGYEPFLTQFQIQIGYKLLTDGTFEYVTVFTGRAIDYVFDSRNGYVEVVVSGNEFLLESADAANVSTAFTNESTSPATGNGTNKTFTTTSVGVGRITKVRVDSATMTQGTDYTISGLNQYNTAATITFVSAPANTATVDATGIKWRALNNIDTLVGLLCDEAGITSADRTINAVVVPGGLAGSKTIDTQAQWDNGTVETNIDFTSGAGDAKRKWFLIDNFADGNYNSSPVWTVDDSGGVGIVGGGLDGFSVSGSDDTCLVSTPFTNAYGTWDFGFRSFGSSGSGAGHGVSNFFKFLYNSGANTGYALVGCIGFDTTNTSRFWVGSARFSLVRIDAGAATVILDIGAHDTSSHTWRITRSSAGVFTVYKDTVNVGTATDNTYTSCEKVQVGYSSKGISSQGHFAVDDIYWTNAVDASGATSNAACHYESEVFDLGTAPAAWGVMSVTETLNGGTVTIKTAVSSDNVSYDAFVAISADRQINSALKRYLKISVDIVPASGSYTSPVVSKLVANFSTSNILIALANFAGKTCFDAIQRLAQICDYEWGLDGAGKLFFRSKSVSATPQITFTQSNGLVEIAQMRPGYDAVVNSGQVTYGSYFNKYDSDSLPESSPKSQQRFGTLIQNDDVSDILLANDSSIAASRAQALHDNNYLPKRRVRAIVKMTPQLDLADVVALSYFDNPGAQWDNWFGNPAAAFNFGIGPFGGPASSDSLLNAVNFKVIGIIHDTEQWITELDLQEVL